MKSVACMHRHGRLCAPARRNNSLIACQGGATDAGLPYKFRNAVWKLSQVTVVVYTLVGGVKAANAYEREWKPRRHYRRMGERIADDWAREAVEEEEKHMDASRSQRQRSKELKRQQEEEDFKQMKLEQEQRLLRAEQIMSQSDARRDLPFSIKVGKVELFPYLFWGVIISFAVWGSKSLYQSVSGRKRNPGRWVLDRSLGGKKIWVEDIIEGGPVPGAPAIRESEFDRLASLAASARSTVKGPQEFALPGWWNPPPPSFSGPELREVKQVEADRLLSQIEQAKNRGEDYSIEDIVRLRAVCQEGGVTVKPKTVGARDAIFRAALDAAVLYAQDKGSSELSEADMDSEHPETRLLTALAGDINLPEERAVSFVAAGVAAACRARLLETVTHLKVKNEMDALFSLIKLATLVQNLPALEVGSPQPEMIASSLQAAASVEERQKIFYLLGELHIEGATLYAELLGFEPALVVPKLLEDMQAAKQ